MKQWLKNAVFYEVYPQSFKDTNADGIGDFNGIIEKLDYIKSVGFTDIWMNPCFASPFNDAGYDISDYYTAAPRYGTNEDLKHLFEEAHTRNMHIILDLVPGHTSVEHKWFQESMKPERNKFSDRYIWTDSIWTKILGIPGINGMLRGISDRDATCGVNFFSSQPALNYGFANITESWQSTVDSPEALETRAEMIDIMRFWLAMGCDGFRVDMANSLIKNDPDGVETIKLWQNVFGILSKEFPDAAFVSEWGEPDKALLGGFDMDFLLHSGPSHYLDLFRTDTPYFSHDGVGSLKEFFALYMENYNKTKGKGLICIPSGNHDMPRISYTLDEIEIKLAYAFLMSMPGVPFIYYGDEIGMKYIEGLTSVEGGFHRTGARSPMQWDSSANSGFSSASKDKLYIRQDSDLNRPTVEKQLADETSILNELKRIIHIRKSTESLQESAEFELISIDYPLVYKRGNSVLVAINPTDTEKSIPYTAGISEIIYSFNGKITVKNGMLCVPPCSATYALTD